MTLPITLDGDATHKEIATSRPSLVVKRPANATTNRRVSASKAATPNSTPARARPGSKKPEPTLLGDFLLGRPSPNRVRRRSLDMVRLEMKQSAVNKLQPPGAVKARVKQWQMANAAVTIADPAMPASEPDEVLEHVKEESVTEHDRRDIKFRKRRPGPGRQSGRGKEEDLPEPGRNKSSPKKRVVSDDHWMKNKPKKKSPPRPPKAEAHKVTGGRALPKDFLKMTSQNPQLEKKIEDWAKRTATEGCRKESAPKKVPKKAAKDSGMRASAPIANPTTDEMPTTPFREASFDGGIRVEAVSGTEKQLERDSDKEDQPSSKNKSETLPLNSGDTRKTSLKSRKAARSSAEFWTTPTHTPNSKPRREASTSPQESIAEIPVGFSAFSVLDIPGGNAKPTRSTKPLRTPSLSAVPKVLKRVYTEGMKRVHDTVDPPRIGINQPPSIESWLDGTCDPFIAYPSVPESTVEIARHNSRRRSYEKEELQVKRIILNCDDNEARHGIWRKGTIESPKSNDGECRASSNEFGAPSGSRNQNREMISEQQPHSISPTGLKRSPATRSPSSPIKQPRKTPLRDALVDAFRGESKPHRHIESLTQPVESFQVWEEEHRYRNRQVNPKSSSGGLSCSAGNTPEETHLRVCQHPPSLPRIEKQKTPKNLPDASCRGQATATARHHRLSTIASVETFNSSSLAETSSELSQTTVTQTTITRKTSSTSTSYIGGADSNVSRQNINRSGLKRRLTKHSDLLSVLSLPDAAVPGKSKSIRSARSVRTTRSRLATATVPDLLRELADDEFKYMRELKTLVDGVIPVLLTCVPSKSKSSVAAGLFGPCAYEESDTSIAKPIVDMGISLEQLKNLHKRIPLDDLDLLVNWACNAHEAYENYLTYWRMGFQNLIVNLAPASQSSLADEQSILGEMPRNADGDVLNEDGERVDVAFLLRRPLVRIKYLAKLTKGIYTIKPSDRTANLNEKFQDLLVKTRHRMKEEEARLEDEAASNTDPTRARDPKTLAPMEGVKIDRTRQVNAKDLFDFGISHSSGQRLDCRTEIILRDKPHDKADSGDVLICEVDTFGRWLLFPPIELSNASVRSSRKKGELVVMIRGIEHSKEWYELFTLTTDEETAAEWAQMLGSTPRPPSLRIANPSLVSSLPKLPSTPFIEEANTKANAQDSKLNPNPNDHEVPIGERRERDNGLHQSSSHVRHEQRPSITEQPHSSPKNLLHTKEGSKSPISIPKDLNEAMQVAGRSSDWGLKRTRAKRYHSYQDSVYPTAPTTRHKDSKLDHKSSHASSISTTPRTAETGYSEHPTTIQRSSKAVETDKPFVPKQCKMRDLPTQENGKTTPLTIPLRESMRSDPAPLPSELLTGPRETHSREEVPLPPLHKVQGLFVLKSSPKLSTPITLKSRRSSSPLKHEYQPSDASGTSSESEESETNDEDTSESSEEELEAADLVVPLPNPQVNGKRTSPTGSFYSLPNMSLTPSNYASQAPYPRVIPQAKMEKVRLAAAISCWSDKGHWVDLHPEVCSVIVSAGLIEAFVMSTSHSSSNGKNSSDSPDATDTSSISERPLVALELTPVIPLRQSTLVDIEIRSPPTARSTAKCTHTVRFRSRTLQECRALYAAIHSARMKNPLYLKLEQERILNSYGSQSYEAAIGGNRRRTWFGRAKSYRASTRAPSDTISEGTTNSFSSAISRLKNLGGLGGFNIAKSSIDTSQGDFSGIRSSTTSLDNSSAGSATSGITPPRTPATPSVALNGVSSLVSLGSTNLKIRLYTLETSSKWGELGNAFLTVTHPPRGMRQASSLYHGVEKRIIVSRDAGSKKNLFRRSSGLDMRDDDGEIPTVILDIVLGGGCFSRLGVVGIVMNVWEDIVGDNGEIGIIGANGGVSGRTRKWMFQCANAAAARWIFALVGGGARY